MAWYDGITSIFTSDTPEPTGDLSTDIAHAFSLSTKLSDHFTLGQLTATTKKLDQPNMPDMNQFTNLGYTAEVLEQLLQSVGDFRILSGFRTKELQAALASAGEPVASGTSFHELGRAVDVTPTHMTIDEFFAMILTDDNLTAQFSEIAIKPSQNSLHLAMNVPGDMRTPKILGLNSDGAYAKLSESDIANYIRPYVGSSEDADYSAARLVSINYTPYVLTIAAAILGTGIILMLKPKE